MKYHELSICKIAQLPPYFTRLTTNYEIHIFQLKIQQTTAFLLPTTDKYIPLKYRYLQKKETLLHKNFFFVNNN